LALRNTIYDFKYIVTNVTGTMILAGKQFALSRNFGLCKVNNALIMLGYFIAAKDVTES
jgi:hypothetical protein